MEPGKSSPAPASSWQDLNADGEAPLLRYPAACPRCFDPNQTEVFDYEMILHCRWNISKARATAADGRPPLEVPADVLRHFVSLTKICDEHLLHVNAQQPGLLGIIPIPDLLGTSTEDVILIDGHHRGARCLREGQPFFAFLLSLEETRACLQR